VYCIYCHTPEKIKKRLYNTFPFVFYLWPPVELLNLEVPAMLFSLSMMKRLLKGL
jgi:hypothetical protein